MNTTLEPMTHAAPVLPYSAPPRASKTMLRAGWVLTIIPAGMIVMSGVMKLAGPEVVTKEFARLGYAPRVAAGIGIVELACVLLFIVPRTAVLGAVLLTGYLGGATATHVRLGEAFVGPVIGGVVVWLALFLRDARVRALLPLRS